MDANDSQAVSAKRVVIVDDDPVHRRFLMRALQFEGYGVTALGSGQEALELVRHEPPDLLVLDIMMPGTNGLEVAQIIRAEGSRLPMVFISANDEPEVLQLAQTMGVPLLNKPLALETLHEYLASSAGFRSCNHSKH